MLQLLSNLLPKEDKFYTMLDDLADSANKSVHQLATLIHTQDTSQRQTTAGAIKEAKTQAKGTLTRMNLEVCRTFVTPFDREDLQEFATTLYTIPKLVDKITSRLMAKPANIQREHLSKMVDAMTRQADTLTEVMARLRKSPNLNEMNRLVGIIHEQEDRGDDLLGEMIDSIFRSEELTADLIIRKDIYEMMEDVTDYYRDVSNVALRIVLKHS